MLEAINWEQLGVSGAMIALLLFLLQRSEGERKHWQKVAFDRIEGHASKLSEAFKTLSDALDLLKP